MLIIFRIIAFVITFSGTMWDIEKWFESGYPELQYFTSWGELMTATYFTIQVVAIIMVWRGYQPSDSPSLFHFWKWVSAMFITAILWESVIFTVYWSILFPSDIARLTTPMIWFNDFLEHFFPLFCLLIEWSLNCIYFERN